MYIPNNGRVSFLDALAVSRAAKARWTQIGLGPNALKLVIAIDYFLAGFSKVEDTISNDQLIEMAGLRWKSSLMDARREAVEKGAFVWGKSTGGMAADGRPHVTSYRYTDEDIETGLNDASQIRSQTRMEPEESGSSPTLAQRRHSRGQESGSSPTHQEAKGSQCHREVTWSDP